MDDGSTDGTVSIASKYVQSVYSTEGRGIGYARQLGAEKAKGEYVAYIDSDVVLPPDTLPKMREELVHKGYGGIHAQIVSPHPQGYWEWAENEFLRMRFNRPGLERKEIHCRAALFRRELILRHRFDPFLISTEDFDLTRRLSRDGIKLGVSSAIAYHHHRADARGFARQRFWYGRGRARSVWKHKRVWLLIFPFLLIPYGLWLGVNQRNIRKSLRMLPYYLVWSLSTVAGMTTEFLRLLVRRQVPGDGGKPI